MICMDSEFDLVAVRAHLAGSLTLFYLLTYVPLANRLNLEDGENGGVIEVSVKNWKTDPRSSSRHPYFHTLSIYLVRITFVRSIFSFRALP